MVEINTMEDFNKVSDKLPTVILWDINNRIKDWIVSGGSLDDPYIKQQFKYAENILGRCT